MLLNETAKQIHEYAKEKGWWENHRSEGNILQLINSEIAEATEEVRNKKPSLYYNSPDAPEGSTVVEAYAIGFPEGIKPEGESVELADAFIRALDYAGFKGINLSPDQDNDMEINDLIKWADSNEEYDYFKDCCPLTAHYEIAKPLFVAPIIEVKLHHHIINIARYFKHKCWDLNDVVALKMAYNQKRSYRHGGKAY